MPGSDQSIPETPTTLPPPPPFDPFRRPVPANVPDKVIPLPILPQL